MVQAIGFTAAALTAFAFIPQVIKTWRTKATGDLSTLTLLAQTLGVSLWIVYGIRIKSMPVIASNVLTVTLMVSLLIFKWTYKEGNGHTSGDDAAASAS